ncbi:MAG: alpha/beta hydrolase [Deltaproteobacteria bacterium]|nr:alpha/beta hydrolase [Deltaproteobacteria bacterium]
MSLSNIISRGKRFPGFVRGSLFQTAATFERKEKFSFVKERTNLFLVPGAFCTSSVMNRLGKMLENNGFNVFLPSDIPYYYGPLANTCPLKEAAKVFIRDVYKVMDDMSINAFYVVGHSNGGLIPLFTLNLDISGRYTDAFRGIITLATPFKGTDIANLVKPILPVARDILPNRNILQNIRGAKEKILLCIQSGNDFLVPPEFQYPDGINPYTFKDFNHMDFIVGCEKKIKMTADKITEAIYADQNKYR